MSLVLLIAAVGGCTFGAALLLARPGRSWVHARLDSHVGALPTGRRQLRRALVSGRLAPARATRNGPAARLLRRELERAGSARPVEQLAWATLGAAALGWLLAAALGLAGAGLLVLALAGALAPHAFLRAAAVRRRRAFDAQLPDVLETLAASLRVGHGFEQSVAAVAESVDQPSAGELRRVVGEIRLGRPPADALADLGARLSSADMPFVTTAVEIQHQVGGSLAELLTIVAETVRERQQFRRKVKSLTGTGRASATALVLLPFAVAALLSALSPAYMSPLWHTSTGRLLVVLALVMMALGTEILRRIVSIKA